MLQAGFSYIQKTFLLVIDGFFSVIDFVTETESVFCAVRTEFLSEIQVNFSLHSFDHTSNAVSRFSALSGIIIMKTKN